MARSELTTSKLKHTLPTLKFVSKWLVLVLEVLYQLFSLIWILAKVFYAFDTFSDHAQDVNQFVI